MASSEEFKIGDIVQLISGGPNMTVGSEAVKGKSYNCIWYNHDTGKYDNHIFRAETIKKSDIDRQ